MTWAHREALLSSPVPRASPQKSEIIFNVSLPLLDNCFYSFSLLFSSLTCRGVHVKTRVPGSRHQSWPQNLHFSKNPPVADVQEPLAKHGEADTARHGRKLRCQRGPQNALPGSQGLCANLPGQRVKLVNTKTKFQRLTNHFPEETRCCKKRSFLSKDVFQV